MTSGVDVGVITESWLHSYIDSAYISDPGYVLYRRDRPDREGGGVCAFVTTGIPCKRRTDLEHPVFECIWLWLRLHRLPGPLSSINCGIVYFPEALAHENSDRVSYLIETLDSVRYAHPDCGVIICGDFSTLDFSDVLAHHKLKQIVRDPTRGNSILDLILTEICNRYDKPVISANLGTSDHGSVFWRPKPSPDITVHAHKALKRSVRRFPGSAINAFGRWVSSHHWFTALDRVASVDSLKGSFNTDVKTAIDIHFPLKSVKIHPTNRPWMTSHIKQLILERQRAFHSDRNGRWRESCAPGCAMKLLPGKKPFSLRRLAI